MVCQKPQNSVSRWEPLKESNLIYKLTSSYATSNQGQNSHPGAAADTRCQVEVVISNMVSTSPQQAHED